MNFIELITLAAVWGASFLFMRVATPELGPIFRLVENVGAAYAGSVTFLIPVFGIVWGASFLGEKVTPKMFAGGAIVLLGTAVTSGKISWRLFQRS
jgi:EamA-like transporter family